MCSTGSSALWKWSDIGKSDVPNVPGYFSAHCRDQAQTLPLPYMCSCWQLWQLANVQSWQTNWLSQLCNPVRMSRHMQTLSVTDMSTQFSPSLSYSLLEWTRQWLEVLRKMLGIELHITSCIRRAQWTLLMVSASCCCRSSWEIWSGWPAHCQLARSKCMTY